MESMPLKEEAPECSLPISLYLERMQQYSDHLQTKKTCHLLNPTKDIRLSKTLHCENYFC